MSSLIRRSWMPGSAIALLISPLRRCTISSGVFPGAKRLNGEIVLAQPGSASVGPVGTGDALRPGDGQHAQLSLLDEGVDVWARIRREELGLRHRRSPFTPCPAASTCFFLHTLVETFNVHDDALMYP